MSAVDRIEKLAVQLYHDLESLHPLDGVKQQKLQLILDAFEQVGQVAVDYYEKQREEELKTLILPSLLRNGCNHCICKLADGLCCYCERPLGHTSLFLPEERDGVRGWSRSDGTFVAVECRSYAAQQKPSTH